MPDTHFYRYDDYDRALVGERVEQFRDQVRRRIAGELTEEQFKPLRLTNGLYLQLHAYMLRIAIPYGTLSSRQLRKLAEIARKYDRGYGHFTTRQNLQLNWIKLEDAPDALAMLAEVDMHAMQTSGNVIRNVTADHFAGAAVDEIEDPRIWCEIVRQWSTLHPEFSFLPRKFKIAITGSPNDRAAVRVHDVGLRLWRNEQGEVGFEVIVGGGLGRTPMIGKTLREFLPKDELLAYLEATLRVYNRYGRRDNLYKARIKILVHEIGAEKMREEVEAEYAATKDSALKLAPETIEAIARQFAPPPLRPKRTARAGGRGAEAREPRRSRCGSSPTSRRIAWPAMRIVTASLKPAGAPPGDASAVQMEGVADIAEAYSQGELRVSHEQNLVFPHVAIERPAGGLSRARAAGLRRGQYRQDHRHHRLPGPRLLRPGQCALDPGGAEHLDALRRRWRASTISATSRSRSRAASTPAAIITSATSASSASTRTASSSTRSASAATSTSARPRSARSSGRRSRPTRSSRRSMRWSPPISRRAPTASASSTPTGASAPSLSRSASMEILKEEPLPPEVPTLVAAQHRGRAEARRPARRR